MKSLFLFQFNDKYLITIQEHTYSCQYGTLIGNCDKQRKELNLRERTHSLWGYLVTHNDEFVNPLYDRNSQTQIIRPNLSPQNIKFWRGLYCRFETGAHPREPVIDLLTITQVRTNFYSWFFKLARSGSSSREQPRLSLSGLFCQQFFAREFCLLFYGPWGSEESPGL